jgi:hypothetical protein
VKIYRDHKPPTKYDGKGTHIELDGNELAHAINSYLYAINVVIVGARTVTVSTNEGDSGLCGGAHVYVDPSGYAIVEGDEVQ